MAESDMKSTHARDMRVLFVYEQYLGGGFETHLDALVEALVDSGVTVCCLGGPEFSRSPVRHLVKQYCTFDFQTFTGSAIESCARRIADLVHRERIDVVHAHPFLSLLPAALGAALAGVPYLTTFHGPPNLSLWISYFGGFFVESLAKFVLPRTADLSCLSEDARDEILRSFGVNPASVQILRNPVNTDRFRLTPNTRDQKSPRAVLVSRLDDDKYKSCVSAIDLFRTLREQPESPWRFAVAGAGNRESDLRSYAQQLGLCDLEWLGYREDVDSLLGNADAVVGMGRVALEALAAGCVTVVAGYDGLVGVVEPGSFADLQQSNFTGRSMPSTTPLTIARIVEANRKSEHSTALQLQDMVSEGHSARAIAHLWLDLYVRARSTPRPQEAEHEARSVLSWLESVGQNSLRSLQWIDHGSAWPSLLLNAPAGGALFQQAMELRSKESVEQSASIERLSGIASQLQPECDRLRNETVGTAAQNRDLQEQNRHLALIIAELESQSHRLTGKLEVLNSVQEQNLQLRDSLAAQLEEKRRQHLEAGQLIAAAVSDARRAEQDRAQFETDLMVLKTEILDLRQRQEPLLLELAQRDRKYDELTLALDEANARYRSLDKLKANLQTELGEKEAKYRDLSGRLDSLQLVVDAQAGELAGLQAGLQRAEDIRKLTLNRWHQYRTKFEAQLAIYRSQRAWQVMLWFRKAYALSFSPRLTAKAKVIKFAFASLMGRGNLSDYDLAFPSLPAHTPAQLMEPFATITPSAVTPAQIDPSPQPDDSQPPDLRPKQYDLIIFGIIDFDFRFQRPQQLAVKFAQSGHRVFWISPTRFLSSSDQRAYELLGIRENLWEVHLRGRQPDVYLGSLDAASVQGFQEVLSRFYREAGIVESCAFVQLPFWRQLALGLRASFGATVLYDCMDDWETFPNFGAFNLSEERMLASEADVLLVTAQRLVEKFQRQGLEPLLVRNAADYEAFAGVSAGRTLLQSIPKPIVGYFGAIADWVDLDLVYTAASARPGYSFVLIGEVFGRDVSRLRSLPNVHLLGHREYEEIPFYLFEFDVCIIPFLVNQVTNATDPVKLYEYFSQGKPVVATAMAELEPWRDLMYIARNAADFAEMLDQSLVENNSHQSHRRIEFARSNTWKHRYSTINGAVARNFPLLSILIVTHNSEEFLPSCLDSILRNTTYPRFEVIVVDNASQDSTSSTAKRYALNHSCVKAFCLSENLGFAGGNNFASENAEGDYLIFLNADTLVTVGWIENLMRHYRKDKTIGLLTPITNFAGNEIKINVNYRNQAEMEEFAASLTRKYSGQLFEVDVAPLYCALMPTEVWKNVGKLDERFTVGMFEDDDLSMRVRKSGLRVVAAEDCFIHHFGQGSFSQLDAREYQQIFDRNRMLFEEKWQVTWKGHQPRNGVRPACEDKRFDPRTFCESGVRLKLRRVSA